MHIDHELDPALVGTLQRHTGAAAPADAGSAAVPRYAKAAQADALLAGLAAIGDEDDGDWNPAIGMTRSDPDYQETRRRTFGGGGVLGVPG